LADASRRRASHKTGHTGPYHELHLMPQHDQLLRPIMRRCAGFYGHKAGFQGFAKPMTSIPAKTLRFHAALSKGGGWLKDRVDGRYRCQMTRNEGLLQSRCKLALACIVCRSTASNVMKTLASWAPAPNLTVTAIESGDPDWIVSVDSRDAEQDRDRASCPVCGIQSSSRHSSYIRTLRDLSAQGRRVNI